MDTEIPRFFGAEVCDYGNAYDAGDHPDDRIDFLRRRATIEPPRLIDPTAPRRAMTDEPFPVDLREAVIDRAVQSGL